MSSLIVILALMSCFAYLFRLAFEGNQKLGSTAELLNEFSLLPRKLRIAIRETYHPERLLKADPNFVAIENLEEDLLILGSVYQDGRWQIYLKNLKNDSTLRSWYLSEDSFYKTDREFSHCAPKTPILLKDSSLVFAAESSNNLYRIDKNSKIVWYDTTHYYHHSINPAADGNIWACTSKGRAYVNDKGEEITISDGYLTKIDVNDGQTLYNRSVADIFEKNQMDYLIHGFSNTTLPHGTDPMHLNDIEAVMDSGRYWQKGDVFFSLRHRSLVVQFRPSSGKVIKLINGPFYQQHDVDILNDSVISLFDNHISALQVKSYEDESVKVKTTANQYSRVVSYDFTTHSFDILLPDQFANEQPYTPTQGLHEVLPNGDIFIESQNEGLVYVLSKNETKLRRYLHEAKDGFVEHTQWVRVLNN